MVVPELDSGLDRVAGEPVATVAGIQHVEGLPERVRAALMAFQRVLLTAFPGRIRRSFFMARMPVATQSQIPMWT